ncbi:Anhydro-N-acetylmuramic acid kinase [hydrothermal vent metagenome]|uniref:Anhydro-N-acetylmuramic acid kinase n=1 Tax=hydrothermal vent metagenome TaxID=652676 RepID=A0A3B0WTK2_9ZZZZ
MPSSLPELYIGLMSGTSMDGIDAALVDFSSSQPVLINTHSHQWPEAVQQALIAARDTPDDKLNTLASLDNQTAEIFAEACFELFKNNDYQTQNITAIGNHGQTIRHRPDIDKPFSLQIGNAKKLAALTGINVISDFRTADIKVGGQGAPLAPAFHQAIFRDNKINRVIVNIGGISNITVLPADKSQSVIGFDCGPGNMLMDAWMSQHKHVKFDSDGAFARSGKTDARLLANLLMDNYFQLVPPKSTGFEYFNLKWLEPQLNDKISTENTQSTLCDLTATSIIRAINQYAVNTEEVYICGGGVHNKELMHRLQTLTKCPVATTEALGVHPDWVEAMAFAWLAYRNTHQQSGNLPSVTGANADVILGELTNTSAQ